MDKLARMMGLLFRQSHVNVTVSLAIQVIGVKPLIIVRVVKTISLVKTMGHLQGR